MHCTITECGNEDHNGMSYKYTSPRQGGQYPETPRHIKQTPITAEKYLRDQLSKHNEDKEVMTDIRFFEKKTWEIIFNSHTFSDRIKETLS